MTSKPLLVFVTGLPCTGKTMMAKEISTLLCYPLIYKDGIKEILFDDLGQSDREWSKKLSKTTYHIMFHIIDAMLSQGNSIVVEGNFPPQFTRRSVDHLRKMFQFLIFEVLCVTDGQVLIHRFKEKWLSGSRHSGHLDHVVFKEIEVLIDRGYDGYLDFDGGVFRADTTHFSPSLYSEIISGIETYISAVE